MVHRISTLVVAVVIAACYAPASVSSPSPLATVAPSTAAVATAAAPTSEPTSQPTAEPTVEPEPTETPCPTAKILTVQEYVEAETSCFAGGVRVRGWLDGPPPTGFEGTLVKPTWLYYPNGDTLTALWHEPPPEPDHICAGGGECSWFFPHLDPEAGLEFEPLQRWVILTGHTRDPRAKNCHYNGEGPNPNPELVAICRQQLVVTAIEAAP